MPNVLEYVKHQLAFELEAKLHPPAASAAHVLLVSPWLIYLPFSHIMQLFFRYYHEVRWDHLPNLRGSTIAKIVPRLLNQPLSWTAPHIQTGKRWIEVAQELPKEATKAK